jgi:2-keto-4-pentenoate hydratase/2-oxohepta-3-ene-1,7-dioic acid hydratase in catechol pathway
MKHRRVYRSGLRRPVPQICVNGAWQDLMEAPAFDVAQDPPHTYLYVDGPRLPFQPLSFRDFMLFERHAIDSTRGYVRRFMPSLHRITRAYEALTGLTFPLFRPKPLWYHQPLYYMGNHLSFVPSGLDVSFPAYSTALDYELELGFALSKPLLNPTPEEAVDAIGAFVVVCDFSARDVQRAEMASGLGPQKSKHFLSSMSVVAVSADETLAKVNQLNASVEINGHTIARCSTAGMQHSLGAVLAHAARDEQLFAGELFGSGTLPGGSGLENGHWLSKNSHLRLVIEGVGEIEHKIA